MELNALHHFFSIFITELNAELTVSCCQTSELWDNGSSWFSEWPSVIRVWLVYVRTVGDFRKWWIVN